MPLDVAAVQQALNEEGLDGWLLYDFHGSNPIAQRLAGLTNGAHMTTRRWYYLVPAAGAPRGLVHAIERHNLDRLPGHKQVYAGRQQLESGLDALLAGTKIVAMEYSPANAIPYISRVDAGTAEAIRARGVTIVSSGDLVQRFEATWTPAQLDSHMRAAESLYRIKDRTFEVVSSRLKQGTATTEYDIQRLMVRWFEEEGLVSDSAPVVACGKNAGNPHYLPTAANADDVTADEVLLLDLWGKKNEPGSVFADITWVGVTASRVPQPCAAAFDAAARARDAAAARYWTPRGAAARCAAGKSIAPHERFSTRAGSARTSFTGPATVSERRCTATGCISTTTRRTTTGGLFRVPGSPSSPVSISTRLAYGRRSTCFVVNATQR